MIAVLFWAWLHCPCYLRMCNVTFCLSHCWWVWKTDRRRTSRGYNTIRNHVGRCRRRGASRRCSLPTFTWQTCSSSIATPGRTNPGTPGTEAARGRIYAGEANRLQQAARQTIAQLRSMLEKKSKLVDDYKRKLNEVRERYVEHLKNWKLKFSKLCHYTIDCNYR